MVCLCPACATRNRRLADPECVVCHGTGSIHLGAAALSIYEAEVVAEAVDIALEAAAREADLTHSLTEDRVTPVVAVLVMLATAGVINYTAPAQAATVTPITAAKSRRRQPRPLTQGEQLCFDFAGLWPEPQDRKVITARAHTYTENDRPHARGLPTLSANSHPSHLARVLDPAHPGTNTRLQARGRHTNHRQAEALFEAAQTASKRKNRKQKAAA